MSEQIKLLIEEKINDVLINDSLKNALDFSAFLRANELLAEAHDSDDGWSIIYANKSIGFVLVNGEADMPGPWTIWFNSCDFGNSVLEDKDLNETVWEHASTCGYFSSGGKECGCGKQPGFSRTIFGKEFKNLCDSPLMFTNPDDKTLSIIKKLMLMLKQNMTDSQCTK